MSVEYRPSFLGTGSTHSKNAVSNDAVAEFVAEYGRAELKRRGLRAERIEEVLNVRKRAVAEITDKIGISNRY